MQSTENQNKSDLSIKSKIGEIMDRDLKVRTKKFALEIIKLVSELPKNTAGFELGKQVLRSATSVGANYRSSQKGRSRAEFISKLS
ncbi:MAG TPA: four helix bundle protein, partial [Algoriphagus sp.]|nr:four helix bundle protein [Algoriphagus sp.]